MTNLILAFKKSDISFYAVLGVIVIAFGIMVFMQSKRRKVQQTEYHTMLDSLRVGIRVKTVGGVIGIIKEIREEAPGFKTVLLETPSLVRYDLQAIYGVVDETAISNALKPQPASIEEHKDPNSGVDKPQDAPKAKKTNPKSPTTNKK